MINDCGGVTRGDGQPSMPCTRPEPTGPQSSQVPSAEGLALGSEITPRAEAVALKCSESESSLPNIIKIPAGYDFTSLENDSASLAAPTEVVENCNWAPTDDFGLLNSLPLVIPASLMLWAVIAAAWIALQ